MDVYISGMALGLFFLAVGIAFMGYFIGKGLQNMHKTEAAPDYPIFIKERDLEYYTNLNKEEIREFIDKHPDLPKVELGGKIYYPEKQLLEWFSSYKK